jgi:hypothetical protein
MVRYFDNHVNICAVLNYSWISSDVIHHVRCTALVVKMDCKIMYPNFIRLLTAAGSHAMLEECYIVH